MRSDDAQLGFPGRVYTDTKANIEALTGVSEGAVAFASDTHVFGTYDGTAWNWLHNSYPADGRLTLKTGVAVSKTDQTAKATLYYTPDDGDKLALFNGTSWDILTLTSDLSLSLAGYTASRLYDIFVYNNAGTPTLESAIWTNATTRATALTTQNGVLVKSGATTRRYLGTIYINSSGGQTDDSALKRNVFNYYHRAQRTLTVNEATNHTYGTTSYRLWNNSETDNRLELVIGVAKDDIEIDVSTAVKAGADGSSARTRIYIDGTGAGSPASNYNNQYVVGAAVVKTALAAGFHYINLFEYGDHASSTFSNFRMGIMVNA